jgi:hypothetical protein
VLKTVTQNPLIHLLVLSAIVWLIFARTLGSYFLADDFGEIYYVNTICNGDYGLIWLNFTSNFMSVPGMSVWRPWLLVSLLIDFIIWKANPIGFYLTNVLSYNAVVLLLYWLMRQLTRTASVAKSSLVAILTALVFAVSPLHCESISWVVGRVDVVCAVFYLLCLNFFKKSESAHYAGNLSLSKKLTAASILFWWIAMWTKEMAIGAPVMALAMTFLFSQQAGNFKYAVRQSLPLWISTVIYFVLRYLALGTLLGGYTQGIGDSQAANALLHWLDPDTLRRLFFPFVYSLYDQNKAPAIALTTCYTVTSTIIILRAISLKLSFKWISFLFVWIATCLAPIYKLWGLGYELEGARFCFFLTMPMAAVIPVLLLLEPREKLTKQPSKTNINARIIGLTALLVAMVVLGKTAFRTNLEWVHAGNEVRNFLNQVSSLNAKVAAQHEEAIVLGIPKRHGGAHMILNGSTLNKGLSPPFKPENNSGCILTFDPILFSENFPLDVSRFRDLVSQGKQIAYWDDEHKQLKQISLAPSQKTPELTTADNSGRAKIIQGYPHSRKRIRLTTSKGEQSLVDINEGDGLTFSTTDLTPLSADYLECSVDLIPPPGATEATFRVTFNEYAKRSSSSINKVTVKVKADGKAQTKLVRIPLSSNWLWFTQNIDDLFLELPPGSQVAVNSVKLKRADEVRPSLTVEGQNQSREGFYLVEGSNPIPVRIRFPQLSHNEKIEQLSLRVTAPNAFIDNFGTGDVAIEQAQSYKLALPGLSSTMLSLDISKLSRGNYRQVQVQCLDANDQQIGELSDPITIWVEK